MSRVKGSNILNHMAFISDRWGESARVKGKPRLIEQIYLGPKERVLEEIKRAYTRSQAPGMTPLRQLDHLEFGASAWLWSWVQRLGLIELVDRNPTNVTHRAGLLRSKIKASPYSGICSAAGKVPSSTQVPVTSNASCPEIRKARGSSSEGSIRWGTL